MKPVYINSRSKIFRPKMLLIILPLTVIDPNCFSMMLKFVYFIKNTPPKLIHVAFKFNKKQ